MPTPAENDPRVHRLTEMRVKEVSLVDRGANGRRKMLIVKSEGGPGALIANEDGTFRTADATPAPVPAPTPTAKAAAKLTAAMQSAIAATLQAAIDSLAAAADAVKGAEIVESEGEVDATAIMDPAMSAIEGVEDLLTALYDTAEGEEEAPAEGAPPPTPAAKRAFAKRFEVVVAKRTIARDGIGKLVGLAKVGRKMSKDRLTRFESLLRGLSDLYREVEPAIAAALDAPAGAEKACAPGEKKPTKKSDTSTDTAQKIAKLEQENQQARDEVLRLRAVTKGYEAQLQAAAAHAPQSNAIPVRGDIPAPSFAWPTDLNNPAKALLSSARNPRKTTRQTPWCKTTARFSQRPTRPSRISLRGAAS